MLTRALEYKLIFSSSKEKFGHVIGRFAVAGDALLTPAEFSTVALNVAKKVGASPQLKNLAKGLSANKKFASGPGIQGLRQFLCLGESQRKRHAFVDGPYVGSRSIVQKLQMKMLDAALKNPSKVPNYASEAREYSAVCQVPCSCMRYARTTGRRQSAQAAMKLLKSNCSGPYAIRADSSHASRSNSCIRRTGVVIIPCRSCRSFRRSTGV